MNRISSFPTFTRRVVWVASLAVGLGCASMKIDTDWDPSVDFSALETYDWKPTLPFGDPRTDNSLLEDRVRRAVDRELATKGYKRRRGRVPDFYVSYIAAIESKLDVRVVNDYYGYRPGWGSWETNTYVREYDQGSLILDVSDPTSSNLLWRGMAEAEIDDSGTPQERQQVVSEAVGRMLERFPPTD